MAIGEAPPRKPGGIDKNGKPYTVLIVDDSLSMRKMLTQILKSDGYDVIGEAENGQQAIERYKELKPDLVTLDINMPVMDGLVALNQIMAYDPDAKIVMATSEGQKATVFQAIQSGAKNYIVKPPLRLKVLEKLEVVMKLQK